ncbi:emp24/gp25L/p24 family/GOLD-domain-containing protein [Lipomyces japonicus]|uniref:emp24/gp25L/p24 family/GOLD-domain-containing protein n=1 Tax=Lipomyces japonicus TaxID=56871 RepID=UPI0034CFB711
MMHCRLLFTASLALYVFALLAFCGVVSAHNVKLEPRRRECFFEDLRKGDTMTVSYQVGDSHGDSSSGNLGIDFWVTDPKNQVLKTDNDESHGEYTFNAQQSGRFTYCFSNEASGLVAKEVGFNVHGIVYIDASDVPADPFEVEVKALSNVVEQVKDELEYLLIRERVHRNTAESTNSRVKWWSLFQLGVVAGSGIFQVYYLKRFFEVKSVV